MNNKHCLSLLPDKSNFTDMEYIGEILKNNGEIDLNEVFVRRVGTNILQKISIFDQIVLENDISKTIYVYQIMFEENGEHNKGFRHKYVFTSKLFKNEKDLFKEWDKYLPRN